MGKSASFKRGLMLASACALVAIATAPRARAADTAAATPAEVNLGLGQAVTATQTETVLVKARKRLLREKNSPSAVTELGTKQIAQEGVGGSIATILRQAPSIYVYQQGIGNNEPVLTIRGARGLETAQTLDGVPMQDLLNGGTGGYLQNNIGGYFNLDQISGAHIYPGVAYPDKNTFGTIGGTVAYDSKRPSDKFGLEVFGSVGSFQTYNEGFTLNSGALDSPLGTGDNAIKLMLQYSNLQTAGFIDYTPARYNNMQFALDKPYDDGKSDFQMTVLYNTGNGLIQSEPTPLPYLNKYGLFSNYSPDLLFQKQTNDYTSVILKDDTYVNDNLSVGVTAFYLNSNSTLEGYGNINLFTPPGAPNPNIVGGAGPFVQNPAGFGENGYYGPASPADDNGNPIAPPYYYGLFYNGAQYRYNPNKYFPPGSKYCPQGLSDQWQSQGAANPCGLNAQISFTHNDTYGIQPRATIFLPEVYGIDNTIKVGGLIAKETQPTSPTYLWGSPDIPTTADNLVSGYDGGVQRTIYQLYIQDKIDLLDNTLHVTPGMTLEGTYSSFVQSQVFGGASANGGNYGYFKQTKWDRDYLPFVNVSYDFDKIVPALAGASVYASMGQSALYAPVTDFSPNLLGTPPNASIVHMYEVGAKYDTSRLLLSIDYFYQKVDRDFGFFQYQSGPLNGDSLYTNAGQREYKGFEAAATWQVTPEIQLFGNVSHLLAKYLQTTLASVTVFEDQFGIAQKGTPVTGIPDWLANFGVDYTKTSVLMDDDAFGVRFGGHYTGHQSTTYDLTGAQNIGNIPGVGNGSGSVDNAYTYYNVTAGATTYDPHGGINPFAVFNLDLNYTLPTKSVWLMKDVKFDLNIQNLFDQRYYQYFYKQISPAACGNFTSGPFNGLPKSNYGCTPQFSDALPGQPFTVIFTVSAKF